MPLFDVFKALVGLKNETEVVESWTESEEDFEEHFNVSYEEFEAKLQNLDQAHFQLFEKTKAVNPEAAVTWVFWIAPG